MGQLKSIVAAGLRTKNKRSGGTDHQVVTDRAQYRGYTEWP